MADASIPGPADSVAGIVFGGGVQGTLLYAAARQFGDVTPDQAEAEAQERTRPPPTVRIQAQSGGTEKSVVIQSGLQGQVVTRADGLAGLAVLRAILTRSERRAREDALDRAELFIETTALAGGAPPGGRTFLAADSRDVPIDIDIFRGHAFTPGERSDALIKHTIGTPRR